MCTLTEGHDIKDQNEETDNASTSTILPGVLLDSLDADWSSHGHSEHEELEKDLLEHVCDVLVLKEL